MSTGPSHGIAVIGMAARVPGGVDLDGYWAAMAEGRELLTRSAGTSYGAVPGGDWFDAAFFGYAPSEALLIDPQQRVFLECAWEALEHAGHAHPQRRAAEVVGVYGGCGDTGHLDQLRAHRNRFPEVTELQLRLSSSPDFLTSRVAYKLDLTGPAVTVQTACSTSLVAVHTAVQALLGGECDLALAGGITLHVPAPIEEAAEDGISSASGHCRAFDADADGAVASDGAGVVVLRRLEDALADRDHIHAVILGSAVTNDGAGKVGFTAPSVEGQTAAVRAAQLVAAVDPTSISYLEAHGTGTPVGDPIEVRALTKAFDTVETGFCLLGTAKTNIGHADAAAGVLGLIRVILALDHELVPGNPHFRTANPALELAGSPFVVNRAARPWPRGPAARRAGVNSLGLGGTNAHLVLEEPPLPDPSPGRSYQLLPLSARTPQALTELAEQLAGRLQRKELPVDLADVAWTLQTGRREFPHRGFVVATDPAAAAAMLTGHHPTRPMRTTRLTGDGRPNIVFLFPGQGGQHVGMGRELYAEEPVFQAVLDRCADSLAPELGLDIREVLFADPDDAEAHRRLSTMTIGQTAVFAIEYALAELWRSLGVQPTAVLGHSLGAYAAAAVAGVLSLPDALTLVLERGRILDSVPAGAMLAVPLPADQVQPLLGPELSLAAINAPDQCVVSGTAAAVSTLQARLLASEVQSQRLHISSASHSHLVEPMLARFRRRLADVTLNPPALPLISDRTGRHLNPDEAVDPGFWTAHLREPVNFAGALGSVLGPDTVLVELGPGRILTGLAHRHRAFDSGNTAVASMPHPADGLAGTEVLLTALGTVWQAGLGIDWAAVHSLERRYRTPLPTYPFQRIQFNLDRPEPKQAPEPVAPARLTSPLEQAITEAFQAILGVTGLAPEANFFELGGDSLLALRVAALLQRQRLAVDVPTIFRAPTAAGLAQLIENPVAGPAETPSWLLNQRPRPDAARRLYCLPHSGGSATEFLSWADRLPGLEVLGVEPPGRGHRLAERPYTAMPDLVAALVGEVEFRPPYLLFGHSLGAAVAYELTVALRDAGRPLPERLYLSAHEAPHRPRPTTGMSELDDDALLSEVEQQYGRLPTELHDNAEWRAAIAAALRADLRIVDSYRRRAPDLVPCPITALGGADDVITEADLIAWRECTSGAFEYQLFPGGHFYFREHLDDLLRVLAGRPARRAVPRHRPLGADPALPGAGPGRRGAG